MRSQPIICTKCEREMAHEKSGVIVKELFMKNKEVYRFWYADLFRCPVCKFEVVAHFADKPAASYWEDKDMESIERKWMEKRLNEAGECGAFVIKEWVHGQ